MTNIFVKINIMFNLSNCHGISRKNSVGEKKDVKNDII